MIAAPWAAPVLAQTMYPANPSVGDDALYVSSYGVARYTTPKGKRSWRRLQGVDTYEPVVDGSNLLVGSSAGLFALDAVSGRLLWQLKRDTPVFSPLLDEKNAYAGGFDGSLRKINVISGEIKWQRFFEGWIYTPALVDGRLIAGGQAAVLYGLNPHTGAKLWREALPQELVYRPVAVPSEKAAIITMFNGEIRLIEARNGQTRWTVQDATVRFSPTVEARVAYFGGYDGSVTALTVDNGERLWTGKVDGRVRGSPLIAQHVAVVISSENVVAAFNKTTGHKDWECRLDFDTVGTPILRNDFLLLLNLQGQLQRIPLRHCKNS